MARLLLKTHSFQIKIFLNREMRERLLHFILNFNVCNYNLRICIIRWKYARCHMSFLFVFIIVRFNNKPLGVLSKLKLLTARMKKKLARVVRLKYDSNIIEDFYINLDLCLPSFFDDCEI